MALKTSATCGKYLRRTFLLASAAALLLSGVGISAQYPGQVKKPDSKDAPEMRAVAVLEYTGETGHPKASRLIPITIFDGHELQDAGIYMTRPYPLALQGNIEYLLEQDGRTIGYFDIEGVSRNQGDFIGEGLWKPLSSANSASTAARANVKIKIDEEDDVSDGPVLHRKAHDEDGSDDKASSASAADPDRPALKRGGDAGSSSSTDSDRPVLHRSPATDSSGSGSASADDPDRPRLQKKADKPSKKQADKEDEDASDVQSLPDVSDPNRPRLRRGKPADEGVKVAPTVMGLPPDLEQVVAVSDAKTTAEHAWNFTWANLEDEAKMKSDLEAIARTALGLDPPPAAKAAPARPGVRSSKKTPATPPAPAALVDEQFRVFELSYGAGATIVLSARTDGAGAQEKFVTLIAQPNLYGQAVVLLKNVTDAAHLDDNPRMRLVDAVDAMADNRGELLFELRGATERQFALYRVLRGSAEKLFTTASTFFGAATGE